MNIKQYLEDSENLEATKKEIQTIEQKIRMNDAKALRQIHQAFLNKNTDPVCDCMAHEVEFNEQEQSVASHLPWFTFWIGIILLATCLMGCGVA